MSRASLLFLILFLANCGFRRGDRVLIPAGFVGLARIEYEVPGAEILPMENGRHIVRLDPKGRASTSIKREVGYATDEYFYVDAAGERQALQEQGVTDSVKDMIHSHRYVHDKPYVHEFCVGLRSAGCGTLSSP